MDSSEAVYQGLKSAGINFIVSVPCVNLGKILEIIDEDEDIIHVPVTREEEGLGVCAGAYFGGRKTAILMQNSGLGNCVNALGSLYQLYSLPIVMIMSHRGTEGEPIVGQVPMGKATPKVLNAMELEYFNPKNPIDAKDIISKSWELSVDKGSPISILLDISYW
ncbi:MAG: sulfopyruvate decarboxylase subunit alpha [Methanobrevibacter arboriphilus]|uniref:sulfopyruvate decarboxylase n=1 Tax=Methanobrevibacter arboriphilus TaxID=39441 RepID=A0A843AEU9_METAZ|nr:sulfopyruvate decarboxylase subunit alpha [Methanobrevibacter arboriphilus]MBF4468443.1 sulfopyruvate decarboxylase subunit alpha [Methanobrevibacter arboriphilus]